MTVAATLREELISALWQLLKPSGFKKRGAVFQKPVADVIHLISLQSSVSSTQDHARVTVNLAVWCKAINNAGPNPTVWSAHWRQRIGKLMPAKADLWWSLDSNEATSTARTEIVAALKVYGLPALEKLADSASLLTLWDTGISPGLTELQARQYAERLRAIVV
jgi:hypothetical protein